MLCDVTPLAWQYARRCAETCCVRVYPASDLKDRNVNTEKFRSVKWGTSVRVAVSTDSGEVRAFVRVAVSTDSGEVRLFVRVAVSTERHLPSVRFVQPFEV